MHKQFFEEAPMGYIPKEDFGKLTELMGIKDPFLTSLVRFVYIYVFLLTRKVFNAFDTNRDNNINFEELLIGMSVMTRGNSDEKLDC